MDRNTNVGEFMTQFHLVLNEQQLALIGEALDLAPHGKIRRLVDEINAQLQAQLQQQQLQAQKEAAPQLNGIDHAEGKPKPKLPARPNVN
jgi:hypothetical protein